MHQRCILITIFISQNNNTRIQIKIIKQIKMNIDKLSGHFKKSNALQIAILENQAEFKRELALCQHEVNKLQAGASTWKSRYEKIYASYEQRLNSIMHHHAQPSVPAPTP